MIKKLLVAFMCLGGVTAAGFGQTPQTVRPRVAVTPTPAPPVIQNDPQQTTTGRRPPVFNGEGRPSPGQPTAVKPTDDSDEVIKVETNLVTMPVSVLDREGRFVTG